MAFIVADRVQETATANTTVSFTLTGAITSYQSFSAIGNGNTTYYGATDGTNWEVGLGTYSTGPNTLTRTTILSSSNSGSAVTFSGSVTVWCDYPAGKQISSDYPNNLGVVTPAAGTFTTITGQTEVLKGTGNNFVYQSQALATSPWNSPTNLTITNNSSTAPDGSSTASKLVPTTTNGNHYVSQSIGTTANSIYTLSLYVKAAGYTSITIANAPNAYVHYDLTNVVTSTLGTGWGAATITAVGSGWYRCTATNATGQSWGTLYIGVDSVFQTSGNSGFQSYAGDGTSGVYVWGVQVEQGTVANTYVPTTSTTIFGTASLSFQNAASISLDSTGNLSVSPAGTGALQAQATTSSTVGGNARGANAVDWQTSRNAASQVASGQYAFLGTGYASSSTGVTAGVVTGTGCQASGFGSFVGSGNGVLASGLAASAVGGQQNTSSGYFSFVGGGMLNSTTSNSTVTTQSGTMNGTTAVTLSGSNANIKVGQLITGTSIASYTYVAAISGTSLTLSQNASGSSTSTLSFYTPHGIVVGGGNNQATGSYSFIGGGGDAGTAANRNVVSGDYSSVVGGRGNTASGNGCFVGGGGYGFGVTFPNTSSNVASAVVGGLNNTASGQGTFVGSGYLNTANGTYSSIVGGSYGTTRLISGNTVFSATNNQLGPQGSFQAALLVLYAATTNATATVLTSDNGAGSGTNQVILPNNSAYTFKGTMIANVTGGGDTSSWEFRGAIKRGANAAATSLVGTPRIDNIGYDAGATLWSFTLTADTSNGGLAVTVTGLAGTTIRWVAKIETTEVTY